MSYYLKKGLIVFCITIILSYILLLFFQPIFLSETVIIPYSLKPFDICYEYPITWKYLKICYIISCFSANFIFIHSTYSILFPYSKKSKISPSSNATYKNTSELSLLVGTDTSSNRPIYLTESSLYQNILITGTIGSGKTSSSMYPFTKQLIEYQSKNPFKKLGMLILDVKGNYLHQVRKYVEELGRSEDVITVGINSYLKYNPLHKPHLKPSVLANRLRTILELFSENNSDSYWLDKVESVLSECIKFCRLYNNGYVTFQELHKLVTFSDYYTSKIEHLRHLFQSGTFNEKNIYDLTSSLDFFEKEFFSLDSRTLSIIKSEITRITNVFISDYDILHTFCPPIEDLNFDGFEDTLAKGKIVVLAMNLSQYRNLSKIIAAYLKLDFQSEVLSMLSTPNLIRPCCFICDEFQEYTTRSDADFFSQSREAKCINIVSTQSYSSLLNTLKNDSATKVMIQNLVNKIWYRTDDILTIENAQKQMGREEKTKISTNISENAKETYFNYLTNSLTSKNSNLSESINCYTQTDFVYDTNFFTKELETFTSLAFLSDGKSIFYSSKLNMIPYFKS